jgi:hypothetical protein
MIMPNPPGSDERPPATVPSRVPGPPSSAFKPVACRPGDAGAGTGKFVCDTCDSWSETTCVSSWISPICGIP